MERWDVERAVKASQLDPPGRLLMFCLLTYTDPATCVIPEKFSPSLAGLAGATGLGKSTVAEWLSRLESARWVLRNRPERNEARKRKKRTHYRLTVASGPHAGERKPPTEQEHAALTCPCAGHAAKTKADGTCPCHGHALCPDGGYNGTQVVQQPDTDVSGNRTGDVSRWRIQPDLNHSNRTRRHRFVPWPGDPALCVACRGDEDSHPMIPAIPAQKVS